MRHHFFLHNGQFLQNLGKEAVRTILHTTVVTYLTVTKLFALSIQQIFPNFCKICNCIYKQNPQGIKTFKVTLLLSCTEYFKKMGFYSCLKMSIFKIDFPFSNQIFFCNQSINRRHFPIFWVQWSKDYSITLDNMLRVKITTMLKIK